MNELQAYIESLRDSSFSIESLHHSLQKFILYFSSLTLDEVQNIITAAVTSFVLIFSAEMGDKSQLVCMTLASKHRPGPVILGALAAFALLNALAVAFGQAIANWFPDYVIAGMVAFLFLVFGIQALRTTAEEQNDDFKEKSGQGIFFATFLLITFAEFGDKTQLAVVALSSTSNLIGVWLGSTLALGTTSALGVLAGRKMLKTIRLEVLHKIGGIIFLILSGFALVRTYQGILENDVASKFFHYLKWAMTRVSD